MIFSDRQYGVSKDELAKLKAALLAVEVDTTKHARLKEIETKALASQIADVEREIAEYDLLKSGSVTFAESFSLSALPRVLIQARIAKGLSQTELADRLGMKAQQVQRYEATDYMSASLARLIEVAAVLDVKVSESFATEGAVTSNSLFAWSEADDVDWGRLPLKEMAKRGWISGSNLVQAAREWFMSAAGPQFATAYHRKKVRSGNAPNEHALLAWQARVLDVACREYESGRVGTFELNDLWLRKLVALTRDEKGPAKAREMLKRNGIILVVERHLSGTYLDGAAMMSPAGHPIIGLTLRHDRLDNFWFVLFHELGHVFLHLHNALRLDYFDEEGAGEDDSVEREADRFALDRLIPEATWKKCLSRFALTEEAVRIDAEKLGIDPSIIAGRIRKERNNYTILTGLVGSGLVRHQFQRTET
jgi:HTH-type transcriptional regulator/antitoxin HigA